MRKSELKNYIKENIIATLSEDTDAEIKKTKELTAAVKDLDAAKKEAGIEEDATPLMKDFTYDYEDIGQFYLEGFGKESNLPSDQLEKLGKKITDEFYGGDIGKAYDAVVNPHKNPYDIKEDDDKEPSKSDMKKTKGLAKAKDELALLTREMKSLAKKYSKAEGEEKEKLVKILKAKTKLKKELESILDKKKI